MAHYEQKFRLKDFDKAQELCQKHAHVVYGMLEETDEYFTNSAGQFYKLRHYNPPISVSVYSDTGEMWQSNAGDIIKKDSAADFILSHRFIMSGEENSFDRVAVMTAQSPEQGQEIGDILKMGLPIDTTIIKKRATYSLSAKNRLVLLHLDKSVMDQDGNDLGSSFLEFQIKTKPHEKISQIDREEVFGYLKGLFHDGLGEYEPESYRDLMHKTFADYGLWVKTLPERTLKELKRLEEFRVVKDDIIIRDFDSSHQDAYFIMDGKAKVFYNNGTDIRTIEKHDFFGEMAFRSPEKRRNANVRAETDLMLKRVPESLLDDLYQDITISNHFLSRYLDDEAKRTQLRQSFGPRL